MNDKLKYIYKIVTQICSTCVTTTHIDFSHGCICVAINFPAEPCIDNGLKRISFLQWSPIMPKQSFWTTAKKKKEEERKPRKRRKKTKKKKEENQEKKKKETTGPGLRASVRCSGGHGFSPPVRHNIVSWRLVMKQSLRPFCWFKQCSCQLCLLAKDVH